ncbi:MAG TPA: TonB-dependent receptor plug domain-containing protein, partial [Lacunisphaera sp.]|nr:TonB-dependent receptor plug domain-containing protein [Lacunisphaera sp.]
MRFLQVLTRRLGVVLGIMLAVSARAAPVEFNLPAQSAAESLVALSRQAGIEILFAYDDLRAIPVPALAGRMEPEEALHRLLQPTGFIARRNWRGKYVVARAPARNGSITGRILAPDGLPARSLPVALAGTRLRTLTDTEGRFAFPAVPAGTHRLFAGTAGYRLLEKSRLVVEPAQTLALEPLQLEAASDITILDPYVVTERNDRLPIGEGVGAAPRRAAGNLDLPRTEDNALPFTIFTREQIARSGVVQLNEFFQRELLDGNANMPPEQNGAANSFVSGSSNIGLRGYGAEQTVVLVNGRRLPETFTADTGALGAPDVNLVPLSLVQQVEVLPVSASALYSGNAVGGVINIVLRPDAEGTELRTTYTNALGGYDAPQSSVSLQHGRNLLGGALKLRLNATLTRTDPAVESELGLQRARLNASSGLLPRATPNVESTDGGSLFPSGGASFTSVAPGADGAGGLGAFAGREGLRSRDAFDTPGGLAASIDSFDYPYGRKQRRAVWYGSAVYDVRPWLQLGLDATYARTAIHRGYDLFRGELNLPAFSPFNPFGKEVKVALHEYASQLGENYNQARLESYSVVTAALLKLPAAWQVAFDAQYARNLARYRGVVRADANRWQTLVNDGRYNPLRDTQVAAAPSSFYDEVLVYFGAPGRFATLGDYETFEGAFRVTNEALLLPTGSSTVNVGADYRLNRLAPYTEQPRFADGTPAPEIVEWSGRSLERISVFGEIQAPLLPARWLPWWLKGVETDTALRYIISTQANETTFAPTFGLKLNFAGGFAMRGSYTTSNRFPSPLMSRRLSEGSGGGAGSDPAPIFDPLRNESYVIDARIAVNPNVRAES